MITVTKCKMFNDNIKEIQLYCRKNNLDFGKLCSMSKCWGKNDLIFQYHDPEKGRMGLLDETPMPIILTITKTDKGLVFKQTENTKKYLS